LTNLPKAVILCVRKSAMTAPHSKPTRSIDPAGKRAAHRKAATIKAEKFIELYRWAVAKCRSGRAIRLIVDFRPNRQPKFTKVVPKATTALKTASTVSDDPWLERALTRARARGQNRVAEILNGADMLNADALASLLGTTRATVNAKRQKRQLLGLEGAKRGFRFPQWQIGQDGKPFSALPELFNRLGDDSWAVYRFLLQHHPELEGMSGREALEQGKTKQAIEAAESIARYSA
jgi:hypothetical protein